VNISKKYYFFFISVSLLFVIFTLFLFSFIRKRNFLKSVIFNDVGKIENQIEKGFGINLKYEGGNTPLHLAVMLGYKDLVVKLLNTKINVDVKNDLGHTPLHIAAACGRLIIAEKLIEKGANIYAVDNLQHRTPLHMVAFYKIYLEKLKNIISKYYGNSRIISKNEIINSHLEIVELLLSELSHFLSG